MSKRRVSRKLGQPALLVRSQPRASASPRPRIARRRKGRSEPVAGGELPAIARAVSRSLAAGLPIGPSLERAAAAVEGPGASALERAAQRIAAGDDPAASLDELGNGPGARLLAAAVAINTELGGDLVHALDALAEGLADRDRLRNELVVATAQSRMTARIVPAVPLVSLAMLGLADRASLITLATTRAGLAILGLSASLTAVGVIAVRRILAGALR